MLFEIHTKFWVGKINFCLSLRLRLFSYFSIHLNLKDITVQSKFFNGHVCRIEEVVLKGNNHEFDQPFRGLQAQGKSFVGR